MDNTNDGKYTGYFSKRLRAGRRRTYFFDVRSTKQGDYFLTITESKKKFDSDGYESHKIFLYKEDFNKFIEGLSEAVNYVKTELQPDYDYNAVREEKPSNNHVSPRPKQELKEIAPVKETNTDTSITPNPQIGDDEQMDWN